MENDLMKQFIKACNKLAKKHSIRIKKKTEDFGEGVSQVRYYANGHAFAGCDGDWFICWNGPDHEPEGILTKLTPKAEQAIEDALKSWL